MFDMNRLDIMHLKNKNIQISLCQNLHYMNQLFYIKSKYLIDITEGYDTKLEAQVSLYRSPDINKSS